ncbi:MAG: transglycosylase SLT domain-containing protein [Rhodopseudomonas palustris]|uniref:Transglycosylase SLT domain-containing protein n=1 Tax=Rhodopseudomonas palustris TaxID=1076 RepID=A0A933RWT5_RHOPL|nr:transglycosylase SLT domain-containing protein [Rhodopseudomonas palustris]
MTASVVAIPSLASPVAVKTETTASLDGSATTGKAPRLEQPATALVRVQRAPSAPPAIRALIEREALSLGLPVDVAEAVTFVESSFNPATIGLVGEIGLMQVRPSTAAMLGFRGSPDELAQPETNIRFGVTYLAKAWRLTNGDLCRALMKYRAGHGEETMTPLSVRYCARARSYLAALGSPYAGSEVPPPMTAPPRPVVQPTPRSVAVAGVPASPKSVYARFRQGTAAASRAYWQAQEARVAVIKAQLRAKWSRVASR